MKRYSVRVVVLALAALGILASCASPSSGGGRPSAAPAAQNDLYDGAGRGNSLGAAIASAKVDAIRKAALDMLGTASNPNVEARLNEVLLGTNNPNLYVYADTMETIRRENLGTQDNMDMVYEITIRVRLDTIRRVLEANGFFGGNQGNQPVAGQSGQAGQPDNQAGPGAAPQQQPQPEAFDPGWTGPTQQQAAFLARYLSTMTYMVYFADDSSVDSFLMDTALSQANSYLVGQGYTVIYPAQIKALKEDSRIVAEATTGQELTLLQYIAQRLNADVYVEIDASTTSSSQGSNYYGQAIVTMNAFETSTGQLLGSTPYTSPRTLSRVDEFDAMSNAIQSSIFQAMPRVVDQSRRVLGQQFVMGIRYEVTIQGTAGARLMSDFRRNLGRYVTDIQTVSSTADESKLVVHFYGRVDDLVDALFDAADRTAGMQNFDVLLTRGKSLTVTTGL